MDDATLQRMKEALAAPEQTPQQPQPQAPQQQQPTTDDPASNPFTASGDIGPAPPSNDQPVVSPGDVGNAVVGSAQDALKATWETTWHAMAPVAQWADKHGLNVLGAPSELHETAPDIDSAPRADDDKYGSGVLNASRDVGRFILGFLGAGSVLKTAGAAEGIATSVAAGGLGDFLVTGAHDPRLVDFLGDFPALKGPFLEALAGAGGDDFSWTRKLEAAGEGVLTGAAIEGVIKVAGVLRKAIVAQKEGDVEGARKIVEEAQSELQQAFEDTQKAYHGSPHDFEKFDLSKTGTGEGSQAFGHGHYVAENPEVGQFYKDRVGGGNLYEVNVKASKDQLLAYDEPLIEQPPYVRERLDKLGQQYGIDLSGDRHAVGADFYYRLAEKLGSEEAASKTLNESGIPAHTFLDQGSRELAEKGETEGLTRNYVVYHDDGLAITSKNGEPVAMKTDGTNFQHSNGTSPLPLSDTAKAEIAAATKDGASAKFEDLSETTQAEIKDFLGKHPELLPTPKVGDLEKVPRYEPTFKVPDAQQGAFKEALEKSLSVPYATLRAEAPGTALEDVLGNYLNLTKYTGPDQAKVLLSDVAKSMQPAIDAAGGGAVRPWKEANAELADWVGAKPDLLMGALQQLAGQTNLDTITTAARITINGLTNDLIKLGKMVSAGTATEADKIRLLNTRDVLQDMVGLTKNTQRNIARGLSAMRQPVAAAMPEAEALALRKELDDETYKFVSNLLGLTDGSPKAVIKLTGPTFGKKAMGVLHEFWVNAVLSGIPTQVVNTAGNARNTLLYPFYRMAGGALTGDTKSIALGAAQYAALKNHIFDSLEVARRAFVSNAPELDTKATQLEMQSGRWIQASTFGASDNSIFGTGINWLGNVINTPSRFLTSTDEFFGQLNYRASAEARARMQAVEQGLSNKPTVTVVVNGAPQLVSPADQFVQGQMDAAFNALTKSSYDADGNILSPAALADSRRSKFTQPIKPDATWLGAKSIGEIVQGAAATNPFLQHFVLPFTKVPTNLFREMVNESPIAPIRAQFWHDIQAGGEARADAMGRVSMGSVFAAGMGLLAYEGFVTGQGPGDPDRQRQWRADGNVPYSFRLPGIGKDGKDLYLPYSKFDPMAGIVGVIADIAYISGHTDERTQNQMATTVALSLANNLNQKGYLQSLTDLMAALKGLRDGDSGAKAAEKLITSRLASYVPNIVTAFKTDDTMREVRGWMDGIMNKIPGLASNLPPLYDNFGEPMVMPQGWPWRAVNPFALAQGKTGPARDEMNAWSEGETASKFVMPHPSVGGRLDLRDYKNPFTGQNAYDRWMQLVGSPIFNGKTTEQDMNELVKSDGYRDLKKNGKIDSVYSDHPAPALIRTQLDNHYKVAYQTMLNEPGYTDLRDALGQFKANSKAVPRGAEMPANPTIDQLLKAK